MSVEQLNIECNKVVKDDLTGTLTLSYQVDQPCNIYDVDILIENKEINLIQGFVGDLFIFTKNNLETKVYTNKKGELLILHSETGVYSINSDGELIYTY